MSEIRPPYGTPQEPAPLTDADLVDIKTRLYGGDAEGLPAHLAELLFTDLPRQLSEVERVRGLFSEADVRRLHEGAYNVPDGWSGNPWMEDLAARLRKIQGESE